MAKSKLWKDEDICLYRFQLYKSENVIYGAPILILGLSKCILYVNYPPKI